MQQVFIHLAYLLTEHNCVVIPGFGGFVVQKEKSQYLEKECIHTAPRYTIGFNDSLIHNDGLLINSLMRENDIDYSAAQRKLEEYTDELKQILDKSGEINFQGIGRLSLSEEGSFHFSPASETAVNAPFFGFSDVYLPLLSELQKTDEQETVVITQKSNKDTIFIPISKRFIKTIASSAAVILLFLMVSTPIDNPNAPQHYASILDSEMAAPAQNKTRQIQQPIVAEQEAPEASLPEMPDMELQKEEIVVTVQEQHRAAVPAVVDAISPPVNARTYYIIVAGTPAKSKAANLLASIRAELSSQAEIIERDNMSRVYIAQFSDKQEAEKYLSDFKAENPSYKDAWLLSVR